VKRPGWTGASHRFELGAYVKPRLVPTTSPDYDVGLVLAQLDSDAVSVHWLIADETYREANAALEPATEDDARLAIESLADD